MKVMVFDVDLANCIGVDEAIIVSQIKYWMDRTEHVYDERKWVYNTIESWSEQFSFWSKDKVFRLLKKLEKDGILITGNYNKNKYDRTKWYSIDEKLLESILNNHKDKLPISAETNRIHEEEKNVKIEKNSAESLENTHFWKIQKCISAKSENGYLENKEMDIWKLSTTIPLDYTYNTTEEYNHKNTDIIKGCYSENNNELELGKDELDKEDVNEEFDFEIFKKMVDKSVHKYPRYAYYKCSIINICERYFEKYKTITGENHPKLNQNAVDKIVWNINNSDMAICDEIEWKVAIDKHFAIDKLDNNIMVFMSEKCLQNRAYDIANVI